MEVLQNSQKFRVLWHGRTELTEVPGGYNRCCTRTWGICGAGRTELTEVPGTGMYESLRELTQVPGIVARAYRTYRSSGYGYECPTELTEVPGTGMRVLENSQKFRVLWHGRTQLTEVPRRYENVVPVPRVLCHGRTDVTEVPGTGMNVVQNSPTFFARAWMLYKTHRSSGYW